MITEVLVNFRSWFPWLKQPYRDCAGDATNKSTRVCSVDLYKRGAGPLRPDLMASDFEMVML